MICSSVLGLGLGVGAGVRVRVGVRVGVGVGVRIRVRVRARFFYLQRCGLDGGVVVAQAIVELGDGAPGQG